MCILENDGKMLFYVIFMDFCAIVTAGYHTHTEAMCCTMLTGLNSNFQHLRCL